MKEKILFIINPISGTGKQQKATILIEKNLDLSKYKYEIIFTESEKFISEMKQSDLSKFDIVVAVGGDGTVNSIANRLIDTDIAMGIIPIGSGNGLARCLKLPLKIDKAIQKINTADIHTIDTATINGNNFVNVAGIGFDAHVAHLYAKNTRRGAIPYAKIATLEFSKYKPIQYQVFIDGQSHNLSAFLISFANSSQFGNNAYISPKALIDDGLLDICMLSKFPAISSGVLAMQLFDKNIDKSKYMKIVQGKHIIIKADENIKGHIDGEPVLFGKELDININPASLKIIY